MRNPLIVAVLLFATATNADVKFPVFDNQRIEKPADWKAVKATDFKVDISRARAFLYGSKESMVNLGEYFQNDANGKIEWQALSDSAMEIVNQWDFRRQGFAAQRYTYATGGLITLSVIYLYSGNPQLGKFIRAHMLQIADLPIEFWLHSELRGYNKTNPKGGLETAHLSSTVALVLSVIPELFTEDEIRKIETALKEKGLVPCLAWLETPPKNNWTAVISSGTFVCGKYFKDKKAMDIAVKCLKTYLNESIEKDGSYGEGGGYFHYPINSIFPAFLCMNDVERKELFAASPLRYSAGWMVYGYFYSQINGKMLSLRTHFGDNPCSGLPGTTLCTMLATVYDDGLAVWLCDILYGNSDWYKSNWRIQLALNGKTLPKAQSPTEAQLPLVKGFDNGENFIRSSWEPNSIVFSLYCPEGGTKVNFGHQRPERNAITLGAYGEYLLVSPASASYRSPLHLSYDLATSSANTISIDDKSQIFPKIREGYSHFVDGKPETRLLKCAAEKDVDIIITDAAKAYAPKMEHVIRAVFFIRKSNYFVIIDDLKAVSTSHKYNWQLHFNNRDEEGKLKQIDSHNWLFSRPLAKLAISNYATVPSESKIGQGYMHGTSRDYSPGGKSEGKPGSAIKLTSFNKVPTGMLSFISVIQVLRPDGKALPVTQDNNQFKVGNDTFKLENSELFFNNEKFELKAEKK